MDASTSLYLADAYLNRFPARIVSATPEGLRLDRTAFYPSGGGQPSDRGRIRWPDGTERRVVEVRKSDDGVLHRLEPSEVVPTGETVDAEVEWPLRYAHMRYHTALHILSGVAYRRFGSGITGNQITAERARMDFTLPDFDRAVAEELIAGVNAVVAERRPVTVRSISRDAALQDPTLVRVAQELMPDVPTVRLIDIEGFDVQADGGTHVANTAEVGRVRLEKVENKGAKNKRLYLTVDPAGSDAPTPHALAT